MSRAFVAMLATVGLLCGSIIGFGSFASPASAQVVLVKGGKNPVARPSPSRPRPSLSGPGFRGPAVKPRPFPSRPIIGTTKPKWQNGQGLRPVPVRPGPNKYPDIPDFVDTPQIIDDTKPSRPPGWRPPSHRPPHYRPPHGIWGDWLYYGGIGYYHRIRLRGNTIVIVEGLPAGCRTRVRLGGQTLYKCNGVYYKRLQLRGSRVYEVVGREGATSAQNGTLRLTKPFMRGQRVLQLQRSLKRRGYNVGRPDGVFGRGTARALMTFQRDVGLTPDGVAGRATLRALR